jgi:multidrug resistance efflux pump
MARQKPSDQIATLERQRQELDAKLKEAKAKADAERKEARRRKAELVGMIALGAWEANPSGTFGTALLDLLQTGVTRAADRAEFGLAPLQPRASTKAATAGGSDVGG